MAELVTSWWTNKGDVHYDLWLRTVLLGSAVLLFSYYLVTWKRDRYPAGPLSLPLFGNLFQIMYFGSLADFCEKYKGVYGSVFSFEVGGKKRVVISGYKAMHELLIKNSRYISTRSANTRDKQARNHAMKAPGMVFAPYPQWKTLRSFVLTTIKNEGIELETKVLLEIEEYLASFVEPSLGRPIQMEDSLPLATTNVMTQLLFNKRYGYHDDTFNLIPKSQVEFMKLTQRAELMGNLPFSGYLLKSTVARTSHLYADVMLPLITKYVNESKDGINMENPHYLIDKFLVHSQTPEGKQDPSYCEANAPYFVFQLLMGGIETPSAAVRWLLLYVASNPEVKVKVQQEIDEKIGQDRCVTYADSQRMPYMEAVLLETLRRSKMGAAGLPYTLEKDHTIDGKLIPAGSDILLNKTSVLHDEEVFEEPTRFKPERYLTGDIALKKQRTIPFGIGCRACVGERLAKIQLFLFAVTLLQRYDIKLASPIDRSYPSYDSGFTNTPKPYPIIFMTR